LPMAKMLRDRTGALSLSTASMSAIRDSLASRLDEARDTGRYLIGLLVFLGLLGTFWGLLETIQAVGGVISAIDTKGGDTVGLFDDLKSGLAAPLKGMGTAFSSSLLGLAGSLILGFLELQASHAHNRFYNELEEWLSGMTELTPAGAVGSSATSDAVTRQLSATLFDIQRVLEDLSEKLDAQPAIGQPQPIKDVRELAEGVNQLVGQMRAEQQVVREWVDEQAAQQTEVANVLKDLSAALGRRST
ncbi:MAG: flagellar motor protein MotA, partial [Hyphomicrobiaceae bacterium]